MGYPEWLKDDQARSALISLLVERDKTYFPELQAASAEKAQAERDFHLQNAKTEHGLRDDGLMYGVPNSVTWLMERFPDVVEGSPEFGATYDYYQDLKGKDAPTRKMEFSDEELKLLFDYLFEMD